VVRAERGPRSNPLSFINRMPPDDRPEPGNVSPAFAGRPGGLGQPGRGGDPPVADDLDELGVAAGTPEMPVPFDRRACPLDLLRGCLARDPALLPARFQTAASPTGLRTDQGHVGRRPGATKPRPIRSEGEVQPPRLSLGPRRRTARSGRREPPARPPQRTRSRASPAARTSQGSRGELAHRGRPRDGYARTLGR